MSDQQLRVMTFNLLSAGKRQRDYPWHERRRSIVRLFEHLRPDVVGTQEANHQQLQELIALLPGYACVGHGNLGPQLARDERSWYCATFYRRETVAHAAVDDDVFWLSPRPQEPASRFAFGTRPRLVTWSTFTHRASGRTFVFGTTHLEALMPAHRRRSVPLLREHVARKIALLGDEVPVFLTGDFNASAQSPEIRALGESEAGIARLYDAWTHASADGTRAAATFRGLGLRDRLANLVLGHRRIDYVFYRPRLAVRSVLRIDVEGLLGRGAPVPSDHYPVLAEFLLAA